MKGAVQTNLSLLLLYFQVMNSKGRMSSFSLLYGVLVMIVLNPAPVSPTLCESRCENAVPYLRRLKSIWHQISKREGGDGNTICTALI